MGGTENPCAGEGAVVLDIGGDIGALVVWMPAATAGLEVAVVPAGTPVPGSTEGGPGVPRHASVVGRTVGERIVHCVVFGDLREGAYLLYVRPDGPPRLTARVVGGEVTEVRWPVRQDAPPDRLRALSRGRPGLR